MSQIEAYAKTEEVYESDPDRWTTEYTTKIWEAVGDKYINLGRLKYLYVVWGSMSHGPLAAQ